MSLPVQLSGIKWQFSRHLADYTRPKTSFSPAFDGLESLKRFVWQDPALAAYIWMAIETGYNIAAMGSKECTARFLNTMRMLVPRYHTVLECGEGKIPIVGINFISAMNHKNNELQTEIEKLMPERIISNSSRNIKLLFHYSKLWSSFIISLEEDSSRKFVVKHLASKYKLSHHDISALDISVLLSSDCITRITEYKWLEKSEIRAANQFRAKNFENISLVLGRELDLKNIKISKVVKNYCRANLTDAESAIKELNKRADFLRRIVDTDLGLVNPIALYYEIL